jgi:hypothetical protein
VLHFALEFSEGLIEAQNSRNMEKKVFHLGNVGSKLKYEETFLSPRF